MATEVQVPTAAPATNNPFRLRRDQADSTPAVSKGKPGGLKINTAQIVVAVTEATPPGQAIPLPPPGQAIPLPPPRARLASSQGATRPNDASSTQSNASVTTQPAQAGSISQQAPAMRSMFPRYDPAVHGPPHDNAVARARDSIAASERSQRASYTPSIRSQAASPPPNGTGTFSDPWAASQVPTHPQRSSPLRNAEQPSPDLSSPEQLLDLWTVSNGQESSELAETYTLGLQCPSLLPHHEHMTLASSTAPLYSVHGSGTTVVVTRSHPLDPSTEVTVGTPPLAIPSTTAPLLASVFPSLAELLALDTAASLATTRHLSHAATTALQIEIVDKARAAEAARLLWDSDSGAYFFEHPCVKRHPVDAAPAPATLPIEITPGVALRFLGPDGQLLLALDLASVIVTVHAHAIAQLSPSLYTLDVLASALLTLLIHLNRYTSVLAPSSANHPAAAVPSVIGSPDLPHFEPPPTPGRRPPPQSRPRNAPAAIEAPPTRRWFSLRRTHPTPAPAAPFAPALASPRPASLAATDADKDLEAAGPRSISAPIPPSGIAPELRASTTGVDLSRFQAFDLEDPALSPGTRAVLRVIYWLFGVLVWVLGTVVGVLAAAVVSAGSCLGGRGLGREG